MSEKSRSYGVDSRYLVASLLCAVSLAASYYIRSSFPLPVVGNDALEYLDIARNISLGKGFTQDGITPTAFRPPLFSALLGGWFFVTGTSSPFSAAVFQSLLHAAGVLAAFLLFLEIARSLTWAAAGALWLAVNPLLVTRVVFVLQEPTLLLFTTIAAWLSVRLVKRSSGSRAALTGAAWGLCTLAKVVAGFAPFLLLSMRFLPDRLRWKWRRQEAAALLLCFFAVIAPWTIRNYVQFHRFIPVNGQGEGLLEWNVSHSEIPGERPGSEVAAEVYRKGLPEGERKALLWRFVLDHPGYFFVRRVVRNAVHFAAPSRDWWDIRGYFRPRGTHGRILDPVRAVPRPVLPDASPSQRAVAARPGVPPALGFLVLVYWAYWAVARHPLGGPEVRTGGVPRPGVDGAALDRRFRGGATQGGRRQRMRTEPANSRSKGIFSRRKPAAPTAPMSHSGVAGWSQSKGVISASANPVRPQRFRQAPADESGLVRGDVPHPSSSGRVSGARRTPAGSAGLAPRSSPIRRAREGRRSVEAPYRPRGGGGPKIRSPRRTVPPRRTPRTASRGTVPGPEGGPGPVPFAITREICRPQQSPHRCAQRSR